MPARDDPVAPRTRAEEWEIRCATTDAVTGWQNLLTQVPGTLREEWDRMRTAPDTRSTNQKPLAGPLASRTHKGHDLPQWQLDESSAGRVWDLIDTTSHTVRVTLATTGHPRATDSGKGAGKHAALTDDGSAARGVRPGRGVRAGQSVGQSGGQTVSDDRRSPDQDPSACRCPCHPGRSSATR